MKKNICKAMVLMSVALMSISPVMAESKDEVYYRTAKKNSDTEDITGDYNTYKEEKNVEINGTSVTVKGDGKKYYNALCTKDNMIYSLFAREGLDLEQIEGFLSVLNDDSNVADNILGMPNPIKDFNTIEEAQKSLSFYTKVPKNVPEKYKAVAFETISDKILQIVYSDGKNEVTYRTAQGTEDITGDYNKYAYVKKLKINDADVTIKGNGTKVYNVLCTKNDVTYSVFARQGISLSEIKTFLNK